MYNREDCLIWSCFNFYFLTILIFLFVTFFPEANSALHCFNVVVQILARLIGDIWELINSWNINKTLPYGKGGCEKNFFLLAVNFWLVKAIPLNGILPNSSSTRKEDFNYFLNNLKNYITKNLNNYRSSSDNIIKKTLYFDTSSRRGSLLLDLGPWMTQYQRQLRNVPQLCVLFYTGISFGLR